MSKKVFISYSWDSEPHKEWVVSLANILRSEYGIEACVDNFLMTSNLNKLMVQGISENDKIIVVVTQKYTEKANSFTGGVGYETELLLGYLNSNPSKIIVILKENCEKPFYLKGYYHIDFSNISNFDESIYELVLRIEDKPTYEMAEVNIENPKKVEPKKLKKIHPMENADDLVKAIEEIMSVTGHCFNARGKIACAERIRQFGFDIVAESARIALSQYLVLGDDGKFTDSSINEAFAKLGGICKNKYEEQTKPYIAGTRKIINYCKKKFWVNRYALEELNSIVGFLLYHFYKKGNYDEKLEDLLQYARISSDLDSYMDFLTELKNKEQV